MTMNRLNTPSRLVRPLAAAVVLIVLSKSLMAYRDYLPPNFSSDFLQGRRSYFFGGYHVAFYAHILSGPLALLVATILMSDTFRRRWPLWHRRFGRLEVAVVLLAVAPSGLWMARYAAAGPVAAVGLAVLALLTAACAALGWRAAVRNRFHDHERWMWRTYLLLASAIVLRLMGGLATVAGVSAAWFNPAAVWASWVVPLAAHELSVWIGPSIRGVSGCRSPGRPSRA